MGCCQSRENEDDSKRPILLKESDIIDQFHALKERRNSEGSTMSEAMHSGAEFLHTPIPEHLSLDNTTIKTEEKESQCTYPLISPRLYKPKLGHRHKAPATPSSTEGSEQYNLNEILSLDESIMTILEKESTYSLDNSAITPRGFLELFENYDESQDIQRSDRYLQIYDLLPDLLDAKLWTVIKKSNTTTAYKRFFNKFNKDIVATRIDISISTNLPVESILSIFYDPEKRCKWEINLKESELLSGYLYGNCIVSSTRMQKKEKRKFLEIWDTKVDDDKILTIICPKGDEKRDEKCGEMLFSVIQIENKNDRLYVTVIQQIDFKSSMKMVSNAIAVEDTEKSLKKLKEAVSSVKSFI
ncbi:unnamed protein product [Blepharisma stoltei]|uniref:START domain-containing protein n=1 Tax=Blepharisma stoltei TaxID=1481888 RepID=A0AAU9JPJ8_9CILI|nr:unnamed protein product [Blepharisma stoltei]